MIPLSIQCKNCGSITQVSTYRKFVVCPFCDSKIPFPGFEYNEVDFNYSMYSSVKAKMDCPACRSPHMILGASKRNWRCLDCGYKMPRWKKLTSVFWFCDECETYLNIQKGFTTKHKTWKCTECGFDNSVTRADID